MVQLSPWQGFYQVLPDGRCRITRLKLMELGKDRILLATLKERPGKALLLDKPFQLGARIKEPGGSAFFLLRIRLRDLEGWPPRISRDASQPRFPGALRCALKSVRYLKDGHEDGEGNPSVEFELVCQGDVYKAWQTECPSPLLQSVAATLRQDGTIGQKLSELQEMRLIGFE
jgi:hypothetical protein